MLGPPQFVGIINQIISNNKHVLSEWKTFFQPYFYSERIVKIDALVSKDSTFLKSDNILDCLLSSCFSCFNGCVTGGFSTLSERERFGLFCTSMGNFCDNSWERLTQRTARLRERAVTPSSYQDLAVTGWQN